jgi:hypothetical protein
MREETNNHQAIQKHFGEHSLKNQINEVTDPLHCHTTISHHYQTSSSGNPTFQARNKNSSSSNNNNNRGCTDL